MIRTENLTFSYTGLPPYVFGGLDFEIGCGEYVSVVGDNGCGKSTLLKLMLKFIKPTSGAIISQAQRIGYVPQKNDSSASSFPITVREALNSYRKLLKIKDREVISSALARVGMTDCAGALMGTLSGGQCQKILIARALMGNPDLLILDEPSSGVDMNSQTEIYEFIKKINQENGITVVSVEHNLHAAMANSTLIYHLVNGHGHLCTPEQYSQEFFGVRR
ncbi:MAG: metal ABC transporter ATP-binding protein [Peptococcaceae bacterium]|jgi:zinc transport system ATP-binding protein|nr:metal ABC transporter ATP-binding protein [Peptococcaceae bacterium]